MNSLTYSNLHWKKKSFMWESLKMQFIFLVFYWSEVHYIEPALNFKKSERKWENDWSTNITLFKLQKWQDMLLIYSYFLMMRKIDDSYIKESYYFTCDISNQVTWIMGIFFFHKAESDCPRNAFSLELFRKWFANSQLDDFH